MIQKKEIKISWLFIITFAIIMIMAIVLVGIVLLAIASAIIEHEESQREFIELRRDACMEYEDKCDYFRCIAVFGVTNDEKMYYMQLETNCLLKKQLNISEGFYVYTEENN